MPATARREFDDVAGRGPRERWASCGGAALCLTPAGPLRESSSFGCIAVRFLCDSNSRRSLQQTIRASSCVRMSFMTDRVSVPDPDWHNTHSRIYHSVFWNLRNFTTASLLSCRGPKRTACSVRRAPEKLRISQPWIRAQVPNRGSAPFFRRLFCSVICANLRNLRTI
jgi:hypothetical protein